MPLLLGNLNPHHIRFPVNGLDDQTAGHCLVWADVVALGFVESLGEGLVVGWSAGGGGELEFWVVDYTVGLVGELVLVV